MRTNSLFTRSALMVLLLMTGIHTSLAATLTSLVNRTQLGLNETLTLTVSYDEQVDSSLLDFKSLEADFQLLSVSPQSSNAVTMINGKTTRQASTTWTVLLVPKKTGTLTIPSFAIKQDRSQPIEVKVSDSAASNSNGEPLQVLISANHSSVYPEQQLIVEIELSAQANVADLNGPQLIVNGADVEPLGQQNFQRVDNGIARQIVVLRYAVFAKQAGELVIPIMTFTAVEGGRRSFFGRSGKQVVARSEQLTIDVKSAASASGTPWFPAEQVTISSAWSGDKNSITVGVPITRTVTVEAKGQRSAVIPPLAAPPATDSYKSYRDQPQLNDTADGDGFTGVRVESEAIVASSAGELMLPALTVDWWNVATQQWLSATLPAETITVAPASVTNQSQIDQGQSDTPFVPVSSEPSAKANPIWQWLTGLLALVCLTQAWLLFSVRQRISKATPKHNQSPQKLAEKAAWQQLQVTLQRDASNAASIRETLLNWVRSAFAETPAASLNTLLNSVGDADLKAEINALETQLYTEGSADSFNPQRLIELLGNARKILNDKSSAASSKAGDLKSLYPR